MPNPDVVRKQYEKLIEPVRLKARELGYAVGVHGSLARDIDLIAVPWTDEAVSARELAEAVLVVLEEVCGCAHLSWSLKGRDFTLDGCPGDKPHGRLGWIFNIGHTYVDFAVMPRVVSV